MNAIFDPTMWVDAVGWTLIHAGWQGGLVAVVCGLMLLALPSEDAKRRHRVAMGGVLLLGAASAVTLVWQLASPAPSPLAGPGPWHLPVAVGPSWDLTVPVTMWAVGVFALAAREVFMLTIATRWRLSATAPLPAPWPEALVQLAHRAGLPRVPSVRLSDKVPIPLVIGVLRPVVLLPLDVLDRLQPEQLTAIIAHEFAHVRRMDPLLNAMQTVIEVLLFFHPAVWWLATTARREREHCCDQAALELVSDELSYARALLDLAESGSLVNQVASTGGDLGERVRRIAGLDPSRSSRPSASIVLAVLLAMGCADWAANGYESRAIWDSLAVAEDLKAEGDDGGAAAIYQDILEIPHEHPYQALALAQLFRARWGHAHNTLGMKRPADAVLLPTDGETDAPDRYVLHPDHASMIEAMQQALSYEYDQKDQYQGEFYVDWIASNDHHLHYVIGQVLTSYGWVPEARSHLEQVLDRHFDTVEADYAGSLLLNGYIIENDYEGALAHVEELMASPPGLDPNPDKYLESAEGLTFKVALLKAPTDPAGSAEAFEAFAEEWPDSQYRDDALKNAERFRSYAQE